MLFAKGYVVASLLRNCITMFYIWRKTLLSLLISDDRSSLSHKLARQLRVTDETGERGDKRWKGCRIDRRGILQGGLGKSL